MGVELHPSHFRHEGISFIENKRSEIGVRSARKILTLCVTAILVLAAKVVNPLLFIVNGLKISRKLHN